MRLVIAGFVVAALASTTAMAAVAFLKHHYVSGMNRICVYDHLGSQYVTTIPAAQICPVSIRVPQ
jgi:hypothetical protein